MRIVGTAALSTLVGLLATIGPCHSQSITIGPGGVQIDPGIRVLPAPEPQYIEPAPQPRYGDRIGRRAAVEIAQEQGMVEVVSVDGDEDEYRIRGEDAGGSRMRIVIDARTGDVIETVVRRE
jgi:hypothetical protein